MTTRVIGEYPTIPRKRTGIMSLDLAVSDKKMGELGMPLRTVVELYGYPNVGKSTLAYHLSGVMAEKGRVAICDMEMADRKYITTAFDNSGFSGDVWLIESSIPKKEVVPLTRIEGRKSIKVGMPRYHEEMLRDMTLALYDEDTGAVILDSIGVVQPIAEKSGDFGEAFMGKRAKLIAQVSREMSDALRNKDNPSCAFIINHVHKVMGGGHGHNTAGGDTLKYIAAVRIMLWPKETIKASAEDDTALGFLVEGQVEKLRYGGRGRKFQFCIIPGLGVHRGVSAMFDCIEYGLAERKSTLKLGDKSIGYLKNFLEYAASGKERKFDPFFEELERHEASLRKEINIEKPDVSDTDAQPDAEEPEHIPARTKGKRGRPKRKGNSR